MAFGVDRISLVALRHPRIVAIVAALVTIVTVYGITQVSIDRDLRNIFRGETEVFATYAEASSLYVDPENQAFVLVEGDAIGEPANLQTLRDLHLDLTLLPDAGSVFSPFSLRTRPDADGNTRPLIADVSTGLDAATIEAVRAHPILGQNVLSADGSAFLLIVTHATEKASLEAHDALIAAIQATVEQAVEGTDIRATVTGFAPMRAEIVRLLQRDQFVLNGSGIVIGFFLGLLLFRSLIGAVMTAIPAAVGGITLLGWTGALGIQATILSTIVPALVIVLGYADGMHLTASWRRLRQEGYSILEAERLTLLEVGPACMLTAFTTSIAFLSMTLSDVGIVRDFAWLGAFGTILATTIVLVGHGLVVRLIGRFWRPDKGRGGSPISWLSGPCAALAGWVTRHAWPVSIASLPVTLLLGAAFFAVPPEHSLSETLSDGHPMVRAFHTIDAELGGGYPVQIIVPMNGLAADTPEGLARIRAVHEAVAEVPTDSPPLSLWSLAEWAGVTDAEGLAMLAELPEDMRRLFVAEPGAMITVNIAEHRTAETNEIIDAIEAAAVSAVPGSVLTGATVMGAREATRTIGNLTRSLGVAVVVALTLVALALRSVGAGLVAAIPNILPIVAVGTLLLLLGDGLQLTSVVSLTIAFGIAVDDTIHYLNAMFHTRGADIRARIVEASRKVGPVLIGTTFVLVGGLGMTQTSGLATIALFGLLAMAALIVAVIGDLIFLPAIIAGPARRLFRRRESEPAERAKEPAEV